MIELKSAAAPYFRKPQPVRDIVLGRFAAALLLLLPALFIYGFRALLSSGAGVLGAVAFEALWRAVQRKEQTVGDFSAVTTGLICALLLPANVPLWLPLCAGAFAVGAAKLPFGALGRSPFSAEAAGFCFAALVGANLSASYNAARLSTAERVVFSGLYERTFGYVRAILPIFGDVPVSANVSDMLSPSASLHAGVDPRLGFGDILFSGAKGPMGTTFIALILLAAVWLLFRRIIAWQASIAFAAGVVVCSLLSAYDCVPVVMSPVYDLFTGAVLFSAVFLVGDIFTAPHTGSGRMIYGAVCGLLAVAIRRVGSVEGGEIFALMMMNAVASPIDRFVWYCRQRGISVEGYRGSLAKRLKKRFKPKGRFDIDVDELYAELEREKKIEREKKNGGGRHGS